MNRVPAWLRDNSLSVAFGLLFLVAVGFQSIAGWFVEKEEASEHGEQAVSYLHYITSSEFGQAVLENWQSEYLQFFLFVLLTIWLMQLGSPESDNLDEKPGLETDEQQQVGKHAKTDSPAWARAAGWRRDLYSWSLLIVMGLFFLLSWLGQSLTGWTQYNGEQELHDQPTVSWLDFVLSSSFWEQTLQNWQSEFLAVGTFAIVSVYLRQRGSPESKPVGAAHDETGVSG
jgi:hypothetical protein